MWGKFHLVMDNNIKVLANRAAPLIMSSDIKRHRLFIEIVTACFGGCHGCSLTIEARKRTKPEMDLDMVKSIFKYFEPVLNQKDCSTSVVNLGTGDYFMMDVDYIDGLFGLVRNFFDNTKQPRKVVTFTTSLFLSVDRCDKHIQAMLKHVGKDQISIESVIDPFLLDKKFDRYLKNIRAIRERIPFFDLVINFNNAIEKEHVESINRFIVDSGISNIELQYPVNTDSLHRVKANGRHIGEMVNLIRDGLAKNNIEPMILEYSMAKLTKTEGDVFSQIRRLAEFTAKERTVVNKHGDIYPMGFALGDILLDDRFGFSGCGSIYEPYSEKRIAKVIEKFLINVFLKKQVCQECDMARDCYGSGYAFYNYFDKTKDTCENVGRGELERFLQKA